MLGMPQASDAQTPLVTSWLAKIELARQHRKPFDDVGNQCTAFFSGALGFMWQPEFMKQFVGGNMITPRFHVTVAKAFELVALFGPTLYWQNPTRRVDPRKAIGIDPQLFGALGDPNAQMLFQMAQQQQMQTAAGGKVVSALLEAWLNYTPNEMPGGGLATHAQQGITEALVKGRACLWPKPYRMPGSQRTITGCFYDSVDNLLIDPDATSIHDARWIAQKVCEPVWLCERNFNLPPGSLQGYASHESAHSQGENAGFNAWASTDRQVGKTFDLMTYYKIYSKGGVGGRLIGPANMAPELTQALDRSVGDYAYVCVAPGVPFPLNAPTDRLRSAFDSQVEQMYRWPIPYWLDDKWPVTVLDFYNKPNSPWPIAPMAPGLGELTFINSITSMLMNRIWNACRVIWALQKGADPSIDSQLLGGSDNIVLRMHDIADVQKHLAAIQQPDLPLATFEMLDRVMMMFDKRVGLSEILYSLNPGGVASRSAEDAANKRAFATIRTDYMANQVSSWMTEAADMEKFCTRWFVQPQDLTGFFGPVEQYLWQQHIYGQDPELVVREFRATIIANSTRKPDQFREIDNVNQMMQQFGPVALQYFGMTGDPGAINGMMQQWGDAVGKDVSEILLQPPPPPAPDPQAQMAAELQTQQMQQELGMSQQQHAMAMQQSQESHAQKLRQDAVAANLKLEVQAMQAAAKARQQRNAA